MNIADRIKEKAEVDRAVRLVQELEKNELQKQISAVDKAVEQFEEEKAAAHSTASAEEGTLFTTVTARRRKSQRKPTSSFPSTPSPSSKQQSTARYHCLESIDSESPDSVVCTSSLQRGQSPFQL